MLRDEERLDAAHQRHRERLDDVRLRLRRLNIDIGGFRGKEQFIGEQASDIADITFVFETSCSSNCVFHFIEVSRAGIE